MEGVVYFSTLKGKTFALDAKSGKQLWVFGDGQYSPLVADEERVYLVGVEEAVRDDAALSDRPVIVLGVSRSGTTLLKEMLDSHSALAIPTESYFIPQLWARHRRSFDTRRLSRRPRAARSRA